MMLLRNISKDIKVISQSSIHRLRSNEKLRTLVTLANPHAAPRCNISRYNDITHIRNRGYFVYYDGFDFDIDEKKMRELVNSEDSSDFGVDEEFREVFAEMREEDEAEYDRVEDAAGEPFPHIRKERLKPKERRVIQQQRVQARAANRRLQAVIDYLELKKHLGYRVKD